MSKIIKRKCAICGKIGICGISSQSIAELCEGALMTDKVNMKASPYTRECICNNHSKKEENKFWDSHRKPMEVKK